MYPVGQILICIVAVHKGVNTTATSLKGKVVEAREFSSVVDFSKQAKEFGYDGDYSAIIADNDACLDVENEK